MPGTRTGEALIMLEAIDAIGSQAQISDTDVEIFYHLHQQRMRRPETRVLRHILITLNDAYFENRLPQVQARINEIRNTLIAGTERFAELALKHSECPTSLNGGLLGTVRRGQLYPELEPAAFALQTGELSAIAASPMGLHLLRCDSIEPASELSLAEASPSIRRHLMMMREKARGQAAA
jgi:nitrogen fixation protein NifM